jgi:hypothetical protein
MEKTIDKGVIKINGLSFLEFSKDLMGVEIVNRQNGFTVPKFILFWRGLSITEVKNKYFLRPRV